MRGRGGGIPVPLRCGGGGPVHLSRRGGSVSLSGLRLHRGLRGIPGIRHREPGGGRVQWPGAEGGGRGDECDGAARIRRWGKNIPVSGGLLRRRLHHAGRREKFLYLQLRRETSAEKEYRFCSQRLYHEHFGYHRRGPVCKRLGSGRSGVGNRGTADL